MPLGWTLFYSLIVVLGACAAAWRFVLLPRCDRAEFGTQWEAHNAGAFHPQTIRVAGDGRPSITRRVGVEMRSSGGKSAVRVEAAGGIAVHEFSRSGSFSPRGPYFIRRRPCVWEATGRRHIVEVERGCTPTSNPNGGEAWERGRRVVEWDTTAYPPVTLREFAAAAAERDRLLAIATVATPTAPPLAPDVVARWTRFFDSPLGRFGWMPAVGGMLASGIAVERSTGRPAGSISWAGVIIGAVLPGSFFGFVASLIAASVTRSIVAALVPAAGQVWEHQQDMAEHARNQERLRRMTE